MADERNDPETSGVAPATPDQGSVAEVDDVTWEKSVEKSASPVVVMFYSPSCVFCHQIEPYFRSSVAKYQDRIKFVRLNIMTSLWTAERYGIRGTPTFKFFCDGKPVREMVGSVYPVLLEKTIEEVLAHGAECVRSSTTIDYDISGYG